MKLNTRLFRKRLSNDDGMELSTAKSALQCTKHAILISPQGIAMPKGLYFTAAVFNFFFVSPFFRRLISEATERISTKLKDIIHL